MNVADRSLSGEESTTWPIPRSLRSNKLRLAAYLGCHHRRTETKVSSPHPRSTMVVTLPKTPILTTDRHEVKWAVYPRGFKRALWSTPTDVANVQTNQVTVAKSKGAILRYMCSRNTSPTEARSTRV